jgi:hypothetical protein
MASTTFQNAPSSSSSLSSKPQPKYEVIVSFSGEDTRNTFTDHLYHALDEKRIITCKDNKDLKMENPISAEILDAIEKTRKAVIILSKNYASSTRCLEELAKIVECRKSGLKVLPVFYHVEPSDVWYQSGTFEVAFAEHEKRFEENTVQKWRAALTEVAKHCGKHIKDG